jgi:NAD(P)-dependent dehydrogenase (short-subunit alcohol dehydrogenase family)
MTAAPQPVAIITGAGRGIGAGLTAAFRRDGYAVAATSRSIPASDKPDLLTVKGDITDADTSRRVAEQALERFGRSDTLINNAGVYIGKPFTHYTSDDFAAIGAVNLAGFFHLTQRAIEPMLTQRGAHRQHQHEPRRPRPRLKTLRVNAVSLGVIRTPMHDPASYEGIGALHPLGRVGEISDVVDGILYLERASFVTCEIRTSTADRALDIDLSPQPATHTGHKRERKAPCHSSKSELRTPPTSKSTTTITAPASRSS